MMRIGLLPGLDGTGDLLDAVVAALPASLPVTVVRYPVDKVLGYKALVDVAGAALPESGPVVLLGESFSGPVAVMLAAAHPERVTGLVLCCSFVRSPRPVLGAIRWLLHAGPVAWIPKRFMRWALYGKWNTPELQRSLGEAVGQVAAHVTRGRWIAALGVDVRENLAELKMPVLVLSASEDRVVPRSAVKTILKCCPHAEEAVFEAPHGLLQVKPEEAVRVVVKFIRSVTSFRGERHE